MILLDWADSTIIYTVSGGAFTSATEFPTGTKRSRVQDSSFQFQFQSQRFSATVSTKSAGTPLFPNES